MTTTLPESSLPRSWDQNDGRRPQTQPQSHSQDRRRPDGPSSSRSTARNANPLIINSILESFDALHSPSVLTSDERASQLAQQRSRPYTADESSGFGMEYGQTLSMNDETGTSNAALPPTVRTSRTADSPILTYKPTRRSSLISVTSGDRRRSASLGSHNSLSLNAKEKEKDRPGRYKLSSESWVKHGPGSPTSLHGDWPKDNEPTVRRESSDGSIRPPKSRIENMPTPSISSNMSRAEQIIALASRPKSAGSKARIYLTDAGSVEEGRSISDLPTAIAEAPELTGGQHTPTEPLDGSVDSVIQQILEDHVRMEEEQQSSPPLRTSPQRNSIVDSIPVRTSSLRQPSSSPGPSKKKGRKSKRRSEIGQMAKLKVGGQRGSFVSSTSSKEIPDSSWNDLGEEDETVKRILELREQRKARMLEPPRSPVRGLSPSVRSDVSSNSQLSARSESVKSSPQLRPKPVHRITAPTASSDQQPMTEKDLPATPVEGPIIAKPPTSTYSPMTTRRNNLSLDETKSPMRPLSAQSDKSYNTPLSLDYSYADAVDGMDSARKEAKDTVPESPATPTRKVSVHKPTTLSPKGASMNSRSKTFRWRIPTNLQHPDVPLDFEKKSSRRTLSLGNDTNFLDAQRDSVDIAVNEYLQAKRLSRKIKHPLTGRTISFSEVGDPEGAAVIICLGMGLTRYVSAFYDEVAATLRLRLITIDRPGVGNSEPYPPNDKSGPLSWPDDVLAVCQHLSVTKFSILAHSAGAIYALATALILPHLIKGKLHLLSPWIPPSQLEAFSNPAASLTPGGALPRSQRLLRVLPTPFFKAANASFMTATSTSLRPNNRSRGRAEVLRSGPNSPTDARPASRNGGVTEQNRRESMMLMDQFMPEMNPTDNFPVRNQLKTARHSTIPTSSTAYPTDPSFQFASTGLNAAEHVEKERKHEYTSLLTERTWDLATRDSNPASDLLVCLERHRDIGFRYTDVHQEVIITHGSEDKRVPVANVRWLAEQMNRHSVAFGAGRKGVVGDRLVGGGCEMRVLEGEGHGLMASPLIMGDLLAEIAGYWTARSNI